MTGGGYSSQILKLGPKGEVRWASAGLPYYAEATVAPDGNVVLAWISSDKPFAILKVTPNGGIVWQRAAVGLGGSNETVAVAADSDGNIFAAASNNLGATAGQDSWLTKLSSSGDVQWNYSTGKYAPAVLFPEKDGGLWLVDASGVGHMGATPSSLCILGPQADIPKASNVTFAAASPTATSMTPWVLGDYPINTMSGELTWKPVCPANK